MMRRFSALTMIALVACSGGSTDKQPPGDGIEPPAQAASPADLLALQQRLQVPQDPTEAASTLVAAALDPKTGTAAVRELLTRTGVPIIGRDGVMLNRPAAPVKVGIHVYDFQVPMLAASIQEQQTVQLARVAELAPALAGVELPEAVLSEAIANWLQSAPGEPGNPEALDAAFIRELGTAAGVPAPPDRLALVSFLLVVADLYGAKGVLREPAPPAAAIGRIIGSANAATPCPGENYDPWDGSLWETGKKLLDWTLEIAEPMAQRSGKWMQRAFKGSSATWSAADTLADLKELLDSFTARAALTAGLKLRVENDASARKLHRRHARAYNEYVSFKATVRFETPWENATVTCGPLQDYVIPHNSPVSGIWVRWDVLGKDLQTRDMASSQSVSRGGGGGAATGDDGTTRFDTETTFEDGCPSDDAKCAKGLLVTGSSGAKAWLDLTRTPPVKVQDLLMAPQPALDAGKAILKVLLDVVTDIVTSSRAATSMVTVERHKSARYRFKGNESVGNYQVTVEGESEAGLYGQWKVKWTAVSRFGDSENRIELVEDVLTSSEPGNLGEIRGQGTVVNTLHFDDAESEIKGTASVAGTATIGGSQDNPTITLTISEFRMSGAGSGNFGGEAMKGQYETSGSHGEASVQATIKGKRGDGSMNNRSAFAGRSGTYDVEIIK